MILKDSKTKKGFTLVEVLVTIAVSGILFAMIGAVATSFVNSYKHSTKIRQMNYEVELIENYMQTCANFVNSNGLNLVIESETKISYFDKETKANIELLSFDASTKTLNKSFGTEKEKLEYISSIFIEPLKQNGIILTITTTDSAQFVSYYNVLNLNGDEK